MVRLSPFIIAHSHAHLSPFNTIMVRTFCRSTRFHISSLHHLVSPLSDLADRLTDCKNTGDGSITFLGFDWTIRPSVNVIDWHKTMCGYLWHIRHIKYYRKWEKQLTFDTERGAELTLQRLFYILYLTLARSHPCLIPIFMLNNKIPYSARLSIALNELRSFYFHKNHGAPSPDILCRI